MLKLKPGKYRVDWTAEADGSDIVEVLQEDLDAYGDDPERILLNAVKEDALPMGCDFSDIVIGNYCPTD